MAKQAPWLFGSPSSQVVRSTCQCMHIFICVWLKMLIILQTQELSWAIGSLFVQIVIIRGINFGHYLTLLCNKALCLKITQKDLTVASNLLGH